MCVPQLPPPRNLFPERVLPDLGPRFLPLLERVLRFFLATRVTVFERLAERDFDLLCDPERLTDLLGEAERLTDLLGEAERLTTRGPRFFPLLERVLRLVFLTYPLAGERNLFPERVMPVLAPRFLPLFERTFLPPNIFYNIKKENNIL